MLGKMIRNELKKKSGMGKYVHFYDKDTGQEYRGLCVDEVVKLSEDYAHRLQRIIWCQERKRGRWVDLPAKDFELGIRACYWVISKKRDKIVFGQFAMNSYPEIIGYLFKKANKKGFFKNKPVKQIKKEYDTFIKRGK
jgi:hypothetical protein